ncbi:choline ABC transporter permease [Sporanaerobium hydrogeniformans]|uniref:Choline ABC transporter permease n=1 Tax=Sporanaerobium hydrogeniformans TaxID=3072179 RepID=A0AC61D9K5_9FIRM|nr:ABC transporter permease [Sporanaerobium hydrogeniformans]PHV69900.1 choline ABC transporter permease [Sporanaerobium hydrogeniformans]
MSEYIGFINENATIILEAILTHIQMVFVAVAIGACIAIPLGIYLTRKMSLAKIVLSFVQIIQTIPGLVMLGLALILFGIGKVPAIIVLALYAILPILMNTYTGILKVEEQYKEAAKGMGMTPSEILFRIELPLASSSIIAGIKISTVYIVSWATMAALIGAGGLGDLIWTGLATTNQKFIVIGAIPAALLAILMGILIGCIERSVLPKGLREGGK